MVRQCWRDEFRIKADQEKGICNEIRLAEGSNGKWAYGISAVYGFGSSYGSPITVYNKPYGSGQEALDAGIKELKTTLTEKICSAFQRPDPVNYDPRYMQNVVDAVNAFQLQQVQLSIF